VFAVHKFKNQYRKKAQHNREPERAKAHSDRGKRRTLEWSAKTIQHEHDGRLGCAEPAGKHRRCAE
jgi:hypothetical protein